MATIAALEASEARFRNLMEGSLQGLLVFNPARRVLYANQALADIFGYTSPAELYALEDAVVLVAEEERLPPGFASRIATRCADLARTGA